MTRGDAAVATGALVVVFGVGVMVGVAAGAPVNATVAAKVDTGVAVTCGDAVVGLVASVADVTSGVAVVVVAAPGAVVTADTAGAEVDVDTTGAVVAITGSDCSTNSKCW